MQQEPAVKQKMSGFEKKKYGWFHKKNKKREIQMVLKKKKTGFVKKTKKKNM